MLLKSRSLSGALPSASASVARQGSGPLPLNTFLPPSPSADVVPIIRPPVAPPVPQGKGLGRFLMQLLELVGRRSGVARLMLTVFHANTAALALYKRLGCAGLLLALQ